MPDEAIPQTVQESDALKDVGVIVAPDDVVNDILPFCAQGQVGRDLLSQADYAQDMQRNIGHQPGIARAMLANKHARQTAHMAAGLAQFLSRRYAPGVVDDGDLDKIEAALVAAVKALRPQSDTVFVSCDTDGAAAVKTLSVDDFELVPGSRLYLRFGEVNAAVNPKISINGGESKPLRWQGVAPEVGDLAKGQIYEIMYSGTDWQILAGMAPWRIGQYERWQDDLPRESFAVLNGAVVEDVSERYPQIMVYLNTTHGLKRRFATLAEYDAAHVATWHTLASGAQVGWNGLGGVCKFYYDATADKLYLPDLVGMFECVAGDGIVAPSMGEAAGDRIRNFPGNFAAGLSDVGFTGPFQFLSVGGYYSGNTAPLSRAGFDPSRVVPTGSVNLPRSWGSLACAYLGHPAA